MYCQEHIGIATCVKRQYEECVEHRPDLLKHDEAEHRMWPCYECGEPATRRCQQCKGMVCEDHITYYSIAPRIPPGREHAKGQRAEGREKRDEGRRLRAGG